MLGDKGKVPTTGDQDIVIADWRVASVYGCEGSGGECEGASSSKFKQDG